MKFKDHLEEINKKIKIVTVLPKRRNNPKAGTEKILVENQYIDVQIIELF